jgi:hypothetical protein
VNFPTAPNPNGGFHPAISINSTDSAYRFEVRVGSCGGGASACLQEGGSAGSVTSWDVKNNSVRTDGIRCGSGCGNNKCICNSCTSPCSGSAYSATPAVGVVFIHVFRSGGSCADYNLTISD